MLLLQIAAEYVKTSTSFVSLLLFEILVLQLLFQIFEREILNFNIFFF